MSLPSQKVLSLLRRDFVVGWDNIRKKRYVGDSHGYTCEQPAVHTTNGAGPRNVQLFFLSGDGVVVHALPGYWHPEDLAHELEFAKVMHALWKDDTKPVKTRRRMAACMQLATLRTHSRAMSQRSGWQGFDQHAERKRLSGNRRRDTFVYENGKPKALKRINQIVHERMAKRPFLRFGQFDTHNFVDYGRSYYDNNGRVGGGGVQFGSPGFMRAQHRQIEKGREREKRRAARRAGANSLKSPKSLKSTKPSS